MLHEDERQMLEEQRQQTATTGRDLTFPYSSLFLDVFIIPGEQWGKKYALWERTVK